MELLGCDDTRADGAPSADDNALAAFGPAPCSAGVIGLLDVMAGVGRAVTVAGEVTIAAVLPKPAASPKAAKMPDARGKFEETMLAREVDLVVARQS
jgi:hypothetical protein